MTIRVSRLHLARRGQPILSDISFALPAGSLTVFAGTNGAGKSTLLAALAGDLAPRSGTIRFGDRPLASLPLVRRAQLRAMLPQRPSIAFGFPVRDVVAMGLHPHGLSAGQDPGRRILHAALAALDLAALADRPAFRLSGGEEQRVHLARVLAQVEAALAHGEAPLLLLDEPTTGLDYRHQFALARLLGQLKARGVTLAVTLHDLPLAARLADQMLLLADGRLRAAGRPADILRAADLERWFALAPDDAARLARLAPAA
jgi:iron complex transport system ATP-binding protein